jgi:hypothetical protein
MDGTAACGLGETSRVYRETWGDPRPGAFHTQGVGIDQGYPSRQPQGHLHRLFASQERDQMRDPRKSWGLSDMCHRELVNSSLSKAKCFNITTLVPKNYSRSSLPSGQRPEVVLVS